MDRYTFQVDDDRFSHTDQISTVLTVNNISSLKVELLRYTLITVYVPVEISKPPLKTHLLERQTLLKSDNYRGSVLS